MNNDKNNNLVSIRAHFKRICKSALTANQQGQKVQKGHIYVVKLMRHGEANKFKKSRKDTYR